MSRIARIAFLAILVTALTVVAGFDLRLALANRDLAIETGAVLDQHERHPNGIRAVTDKTLDEHERRATRLAPAGAIPSVPAALDEHERRAASR